MSNQLQKAKDLNADFMDLYGNCLEDYIQLDIKTTTFQTIVDVVNTNKTHGYIHYIKVGEKFVMAQRKYTYSGFNVIKTNYVHIFIVKDFENKQVIERYRQTKTGWTNY